MNAVSTPLDIPKLVTQNVEELTNVRKDIASIKTKLETKDLEIEYLSTEIKVAYSIIETLQQRVSELEQQANKSSRDCVNVAGPPSPTHCLLLGDSNLRGVIRSDLADTCSVRTITEANMDLLRSWFTPLSSLYIPWRNPQPPSSPIVTFQSPAFHASCTSYDCS
ncbi:hypothetical protein Pcinc_023287 [Petrolisthes cinctipes]|uniref:Uncharacterized protein n=1 Tax=Petrolisthes cinctipes TaxID=88211 RepID=A0AAE1KFY9_PETCI|nr:hypothetical protein Pcinc_023287 [Petrolisthes cinctipes]